MIFHNNLILMTVTRVVLALIIYGIRGNLRRNFATCMVGGLPSMFLDVWIRVLVISLIPSFLTGSIRYGSVPVVGSLMDHLWDY